MADLGGFGPWRRRAGASRSRIPDAGGDGTDGAEAEGSAQSPPVVDPRPPAPRWPRGSAAPEPPPPPETAEPGPATPPIGSPRTSLSARVRTRLKGPEGLREAFAIREFLDLPLALRRRRRRAPGG